MPTELPDVRNRSMDLLGRMPGGGLAHIELQSAHDPKMARRMAEYLLDIERIHGVYARQFVLYVGRAPLRMTGRLDAPGMKFQCPVADIRELDAASLLGSPLLEDNVIAILGRLGDRREAVREVLRRIAKAPAARRSAALTELSQLAGLRRIGGIIEKEIETMPVLIDIMDNDLLGPVMRRGLEQGKAEGRAEEGRRLVTGLLSARFGAVPPQFQERLKVLSPEDMEALSLRILSAGSVEDAFR